MTRETDPDPDPWAFFAWGRVRAVVEAVRSDLISLEGVFATAVVLALATEISPTSATGQWYGRAGHAVIVVSAAILALAVLDTTFRALTYEHTSNRRWQIDRWQQPEGAHVIFRSRNRERRMIPEFTEVRIRRPDGVFIEPDRNDPDRIDGGFFGFSEPGAMLHASPLQVGEHEVRVYRGTRGPELARTTLNLPEPRPR